MEMIIDVERHKVAHTECLKAIETTVHIPGNCNATWDGMLCWTSTVADAVIHQVCPPYVYGISKTEFAARVCTVDGVWSNYDIENVTGGWTNYTDCFKEDPELTAMMNDIWKIQLMSNIGYGVSLVSLVVAVLIMLICRRLHCKSNSLHINLFMAFICRAVISFVKESVFVQGVGLEKDVLILPDGVVEFNPDGTHWECKLLVVIFMYTVASSLMWIFMEALYLHMLVYKTLFTERTGIRMYVVIGWLSPFLYVIPWAAVRLFIDNELCWNTDEYGYMWVYKGPIIVTILINFIFFVNIIRVLCIRMRIHSNSNTKRTNQQIRKLAKFSLVLIPLFGIPYIASAAYPHGINMQADIVYLYCEMFYNSFQGFLLAVLFCFLNEEVHNEIRRCWYSRGRRGSVFQRNFTLMSYRKGSCMSQTSVPLHARESRKSLTCKVQRDTDTMLTCKYNGTQQSRTNGTKHYASVNRDQV